MNDMDGIGKVTQGLEQGPAGEAGGRQPEVRAEPFEGPLDSPGLAAPALTEQEHPRAVAEGHTADAAPDAFPLGVESRGCSSSVSESTSPLQGRNSFAM